MSPEPAIAFARFFAGVFGVLVLLLIAVGINAAIDWINRNLR